MLLANAFMGEMVVLKKSSSRSKTLPTYLAYFCISSLYRALFLAWDFARFLLGFQMFPSQTSDCCCYWSGNCTQPVSCPRLTGGASLCVFPGPVLGALAALVG